MTGTTRNRIPPHLHKYIVAQNYARYTPEDQAVWRYIMRQLRNFLSTHAHSSYLEGLSKTGISVDQIPRIEVVDEHLNRFGWGAVPVSGFIPPAAFMEFQSIGVLPIASDMRTIDHLLYTPAPDIVHEAAGHAPILINPDYAAYLRQYGEVACNTIISKEDMAQYEAIRILSDCKEDPNSTPHEIQQAEAHLANVNQAMKHVSEAALLSRMNWWTAEYGLIGSIDNAKIFGAGLLSSVGESRASLDQKVKKIPLTVDCVNYSYDITEPQPQLFVARDFAQLGEVLEKLAQQLSYRLGGAHGLDRAIEAETVNTVQLNSGIQISGVVKKYLKDSTPIYLQFEGPTQLSVAHCELEGQGTAHHAQGFSTPVGLLRDKGQCLSTFQDSDLSQLGIQRGERAKLTYQSGVEVEGRVHNWTRADGKLILITWKECRVKLGSQTLFEPSWGDYDMAVGSQITSVFGGQADREKYGQINDFVAKQIPSKTYSEEKRARHKAFQKLRDMRSIQDPATLKTQFQSLFQEFQSQRDWLQGVELLEIANAHHFPEASQIQNLLKPENFTATHIRECVSDGVALATRPQ